MKKVFLFLSVFYSVNAMATSNWLLLEGVTSVTMTQSAENSEIHYDYRDDAAKKADDTESGYRVRISAKEAFRKVGSGDWQDVKGGAPVTVSFGFDPKDPLHRSCLQTIANGKKIQFGDTGAGLDCTIIND